MTTACCRSMGDGESGVRIDLVHGLVEAASSLLRGNVTSQLLPMVEDIARVSESSIARAIWNHARTTVGHVLKSHCVIYPTFKINTLCCQLLRAIPFYIMCNAKFMGK